MTKNNNLLEISHNQIDQCLAFAHLLAKIMYYGRSTNRPNNPASDHALLLSLQQMREILQTKMQIDAHFNLTSIATSAAPMKVSRQIINTQIAKVLINVLCIALRNSLKGNVFDHGKFLRAVENIW